MPRAAPCADFNLSSTEPPWGISQDKYLDIGGVVVMQKAILGPEARLDTGGWVIITRRIYPVIGGHPPLI